MRNCSIFRGSKETIVEAMDGRNQNSLERVTDQQIDDIKAYLEIRGSNKKLGKNIIKTTPVLRTSGCPKTMGNDIKVRSSVFRRPILRLLSRLKAVLQTEKHIFGHPEQGEVKK